MQVSNNLKFVKFVKLFVKMFVIIKKLLLVYYQRHNILIVIIILLLCGNGGCLFILCVEISHSCTTSRLER